MTHQIRHSFVGALACLSLLFSACSDSEDNTPSLADVNIFEPAPDDQSETAQIRREFFGLTGSYLLFTDTLRTIVSGQSLDGSATQRTELLDIMAYSMLGFGESTTYRYGYITSPDSQRMAADLVRTYLVPRLGKACPFSFLLLNRITQYDSSLRKDVGVSKLLGLRAYAISLADGEAYTQPDDYFRAMVGDMVRSKVQTLTAEDLDAFYAFSRSYYGEDESHFGLSTSRSADTEMYPFGFFSDVYYYRFPDASYDLRQWLAIVLTYTRDRFLQLYGSQPIMVGKYDALRAIITEDLGYVLD